MKHKSHYPEELTEADHRQKGKLSNIPECCVEFFVKEWNPYRDNEEAKWVRGEYIKQIERVYYDSPEVKLRQDFCYVVCPECLKNKRFVKIHRCSEECGYCCV